jgi:hypothetical protein
VLNLHKPRDRMHFEQFGQFHRTFYRAVEATSVTPSLRGSGRLDTRLDTPPISIRHHPVSSLAPLPMRASHWSMRRTPGTWTMPAPANTS